MTESDTPLVAKLRAYRYGLTKQWVPGDYLDGCDAMIGMAAGLEVPPTEPDLKVQIEKLSPREGDLLLVKCGELSEGARLCLLGKLERILGPLKCKAVFLETGIDAKLLDGEAMARAAAMLEIDANLDAGSLGGPDLKQRVERQRQTAKTIREWLIPKDEKGQT